MAGEERKGGFGLTAWPAPQAPAQQQPAPAPAQQTTSPTITMQLALRSAAEQQAALVAQRAAQEQQAEAAQARYEALETYTQQAVAGLHGAKLNKATADGQALFRGIKLGCGILLVGGVAAVAIHAWP